MFRYTFWLFSEDNDKNFFLFRFTVSHFTVATQLISFDEFTLCFFMFSVYILYIYFLINVDKKWNSWDSTLTWLCYHFACFLFWVDCVIFVKENLWLNDEGEVCALLHTYMELRSRKFSTLFKISISFLFFWYKELQKSFYWNYIFTCLPTLQWQFLSFLCLPQIM